MNVAFDPWIPVVTATGDRELISLSCALAEGGKYADLAVRPHERVALMRLFLCVAHAALEGPKDYDEWCEVPKKLPEASWKYLEKWKDSFELFHPRKPWLQVAELKIVPKENSNEDKEWSSLAKIDFTRASGNNSTLFDHSSNGKDNDVWADHEVALNLLSFQNFFVAGGKASSRMWGEIAMKNPPNPKGGPCAGKSILFSFIRGNNLTSSIHLNLNSYEDLKYIYGDTTKRLGKPLWEMPIDNPKHQDSIKNATCTHIGRLVPQTRILRLHEDRTKVLLGAGFEYPKFQDGKNTFEPDVFATIVTEKEGERTLLSAKPNRAVWRELHSLAVRQKNNSDLGRGPLCLMNIPESSPCDLVVNTMITNPKQAAEIVDLIESVSHVPSQLFTANGTIIYEAEVKMAENLALRLGWAIEDYRKEIDDNWLKILNGEKKVKGVWGLKAKLHATATNHYWTMLEKNLSLLMSHIEAIGPDDAIPTRKIWRKMLFSSACDAYRIACGRETPRRMRAFAKGWQKLTSRKNGTNKNETREENP